MTPHYHERTVFTQIRAWAVRLLLGLGVLCGLGGCSVSMPMGSLLDDSAPASVAAAPAGAPGKGKIDVAVAQPPDP
jgi:hypothetical protein